MKTNERANVTMKRVFFYPGKDCEYNLKAIPADHTLIAGLTGTGKTVMINQIIIQLMQMYSPNDICISIINGHGENVDYWRVKKNGKVDDSRVVSSIGMIKQTVDASRDDYMSVDRLFELIEELCFNKEERIKNGFNVQENDIVIIDDIEFDHSHVDKVTRLFEKCRKVGIYVIWAVQSSDCHDKKFVNMFKNFLCLRCTEEASKNMLGCDIASHENLNEVGVCYYRRSISSMWQINKIWIPFTPDTVINKIVGAFSVRLDNVHPILKNHKDNLTKVSHVIDGILNEGRKIELNNFVEFDRMMDVFRHMGIKVSTCSYDRKKKYERIYCYKADNKIFFVFEEKADAARLTVNVRSIMIV